LREDISKRGPLQEEAGEEEGEEGRDEPVSSVRPEDDDDDAVEFPDESSDREEENDPRFSSSSSSMITCLLPCIKTTSIFKCKTITKHALELQERDGRVLL